MQVQSATKRPHAHPTTSTEPRLRQLLGALRRAELGDFSARLPQPESRPHDGGKGAGDVLDEIARAFNSVVGLNEALTRELVRVENVVGREGCMTERATLAGAGAGWGVLVGSVNALIEDLVRPTTEVARVILAVAEGDLTQKMALDIDGQLVKGEFLRIGTTVNAMVDQLSSFSAEVTRVAKEVGTDGKLGGQANVRGVSGTWKDLTDNVNLLANNLTAQVRNIAEVSTAVANGDLSRKITVDARGEVFELKSTINTMVDQLRSFAAEVTRVAKEVGTDGKLGGQADVKDVSGVWKDLTDNVNFMASNLTMQVRGIVRVVTAVANGDLTQRLVVDAKGEIAALAETLNSMTNTLGIFAQQVTSVAKTVGVEGKLGAQAEVPGVAGTWKDLTDNVNLLANNLTAQVRNIAEVSTAVANGDLSRKITVDAKGEVFELKSTINTMVDQLRSFAAEVTRVAREVGTEGKLGGQADVKGVSGVWKDLTDNVNFMARNLTDQVRNIAKVSTGIANGDLSQKITVEALGEILELKSTINVMVDQLRSFASEVTRVAREVGTDGKLGGQAEVPGVAGVWKHLTDNVNSMASNLTTQVRGIVKVVTAVADGDLSQRLILDAKGEVAALAETINSMTNTLGVFAEQVSTVAREVGIEGKLGGQAKVPGAVGTWRQLTDNVNQLAGNLTTQVRAISEVATAVTKGDLTRSITVEAQGEVASLKDNINQMIVNLKETTQKNAEQDWLKTNLAKFSSMMQGQKNLSTVSRLIMSELTPLVSAHYGAFFIVDAEGDVPVLKLTSSYAYRQRKSVSNRFFVGEGLVGQCALEKKTILLTSVPGDYIQISSGLGEAPPLDIIVLPVLFEGEVKAVIELASFCHFSAIHQIFLDQLTESIGVVLNMISANMRTEQLLLQSQGLAQELQSQSMELTGQQDELKRSNVRLERQAIELEEKAKLLEQQNRNVEVKNREVEQARRSLEDKAEQLALISKYKSEFLANMSHELRTPLNSLIILARLLAENKDANLSAQQIEYARTVLASGEDLLTLINEILDLAKVESGKMQVEPRRFAISALKDFVERSFRAVAAEKRLDLAIDVADAAPAAIVTDPQRLQQVLKNLLANAFKFTERGGVTLRVGVAPAGMKFASPALDAATRVVSFAVADTGIGIPRDKQQIIFEAFQQADGTTNRRYGGTGLGLSISREITKLLGGEIHVSSEQGRGSTFSLYLPADGEGGGAREALPAPIVVDDDRDRIREGDRVVLIIEDDPAFARILVSAAHEGEFKAVVAMRGDEGLTLANELLPNAITLDLKLPVVDGWSVLDRLKRNPRTRSIPVHVISVVDRAHRGATMGAFAYLEKPIRKETIVGAFQHIAAFLDRSVRRLLLVGDEGDGQRRSLVELLGDGDDLVVKSASTGAEALAELESKEYDCVVLDLVLLDREGHWLLETIKGTESLRDVPIVVYVGDHLPREEEARLRGQAESVIVKSCPTSAEQLARDTSLFLHRIHDDLPARAREMIERAAAADAQLGGKKVLIIDDDVRNVFALTSLLESLDMEVAHALDGKSGIDALRSRPDVDVVLVDMMMPGMDGHDTIATIRQDPAFGSLPLIAVTAKALKDDRERCVRAGASDYLPKPVDRDRLIELLQRWTRR